MEERLEITGESVALHRRRADGSWSSTGAWRWPTSSGS